MDVMTPLKITVCCQLLNICLDPLFIFGWGPIGALGVAGARPAPCLLCAERGATRTGAGFPY